MTLLWYKSLPACLEVGCFPGSCNKRPFSRTTRARRSVSTHIRDPRKKRRTRVGSLQAALAFLLLGRDRPGIKAGSKTPARGDPPPACPGPAPCSSPATCAAASIAAQRREWWRLPPSGLEAPRKKALFTAAGRNHLPLMETHR